MKKLFCVFLVLICLCSSTWAEETKYFDLNYGDFFDLEPGVYEVGKDFQSGNYDIRFNGLDQSVTISYSYELDDSGMPDLTNDNSFSFTFESASSWWNIGGFLVKLFPGSLRIENCRCRLWVEK